jgi:hypothetical protein
MFDLSGGSAGADNPSWRFVNMGVDPHAYKLDLSKTARVGKNSSNSTAPAQASRPFLSVHFACCGVYMRIYRDADGRQYQGHCPRCARPVRFMVGPDGSTSRSFTVT